jgi:hypothetical protein
MSPTRRSGKALTSRSGGNMPQHDGCTFDYVRSGADGGGAVYIALRLLGVQYNYAVLCQPINLVG